MQDATLTEGKPGDEIRRVRAGSDERGGFPAHLWDIEEGSSVSHTTATPLAAS